jgi:hypothetical protein
VSAVVTPFTLSKSLSVNTATRIVTSGRELRHCPQHAGGARYEVEQQVVVEALLAGEVDVRTCQREGISGNAHTPPE